MKLLSLHISGFGKLTNFDYEFNEKLTVISKENGWGKTTFASFIKAMFYSLPTTRQKNLDNNPRKKYKPWDSVVFGGNLTFEHGSKTYRIERSFGASETEDTFALFDAKTNKSSFDFSSNIGFELFGLNAESFSRTTFVPQLDLKTELTDNISAKLNNLVEDKADLISFNKAKEIIDNTRKIYVKTGERGLLHDKERELEKIEQQQLLLANLENNIEILSKKIKDSDQKIATLEMQEKDINQKINLASTKEKVQLEKDNYKKLENEIKNAKQQLEELNLILKSTPPSNEELSNMKTLIAKERDLESQISSLENDIASLKKDCDLLSDFFNKQPLDESKIQTTLDTFSQLQNHKKNISTNDISISSYSTKSKKTQIAVICVAFAIISIISILFAVSIIGVLPFIISATAIATIAITLLIVFRSSKQNIKFLNNDKIAKDLEQKLISLLDYSYEEELDLSTKVYLLNKNSTEFKELQNQIFEKTQSLNNLKAEHAKINTKTGHFLQFYFPNQQNLDPYDALYKLGAMCFEFKNISSKLNENQKLIETLTNHENSEVSIENIESSEELITQKQTITSQIQNLRREQSQNQTHLSTYLSKAEELDELDAKKSALKNEIEEINHKIKILKHTDSLLDDAKDELDSMFLGPITETFAELANRLSATELEAFRIDTNLNISVDHNGVSKEISFLSRGYQDIAYIISRIACIKAMFKETKPFVVLDDPFVNLDEQKLNLAKNLLKTLSEEYQIVYLVCNNSRS
ncbi:MAG: hypothetical protein IJW24_03375 [Clostridia bacterium]|nr:hypothetical protein [Clostridia bacterium]